eukprot:TRINITY_DN9302_c0_g1_i1.p1 TRINITY_DN9302_c0_g1~~TRINITY_DN9302_c0_g1_i1.p1  ORF type:complete len:107 (+),score=14.25 TRINITY_DN9302_c0_g1_i1:31-351(+)
MSSPVSTPSPVSTKSLDAPGKVVIIFKATGGAPALKQSTFKIGTSANFKTVVGFLKKQLKLPGDKPLYLFINNFQPNLEETVEDLFKCFQYNGKLYINYCDKIAYG